MKHSKMDSADTKMKVVQGLVTGRSQEEIAKENGVSQSSVSRFAAREDIKTLIDEQARRLAESIPDAVNNYREVIKSFPRLEAKDYDGKKLAVRASERVLEAAGVLNSGQPNSIFVTFTQHSIYFDHPIIEEVLKRFGESLKLPDETEDI